MQGAAAGSPVPGRCNQQGMESEHRARASPLRRASISHWTRVLQDWKGKLFQVDES